MRSQTALILGGIAAAAAAAWWYSQRQAALSQPSTAQLNTSGWGIGSMGQAADQVTSALQSGIGGISDFIGSIGVTPRGIRNNNPLNLRFIPDPARAWNGQTGNDGGYGIYATPALGVRAASKQLQKDYADKGGTTLGDLITIWAPPTENNTAAYIADVADRTGLDPSAPLDLYGNLPIIVPAMIWHENGEQPYAQSDLAQWVYLT